MLSLMAKKGIIRRIYTQNIDGLERDAGLQPPSKGICSAKERTFAT